MKMGSLFTLCAIRLLLLCPTRPAYRSLAVPIKMFVWSSRNRKLSGPGILAITGFYVLTEVVKCDKFAMNQRSGFSIIKKSSNPKFHKE